MGDTWEDRYDRMLLWSRSAVWVRVRVRVMVGLELVIYLILIKCYISKYLLLRL